MILHVSNLVILNAFLAIETRFGDSIKSEKGLLEGYTIQFYILLLNTVQFSIDMIATFIVKDFRDIWSHHKLQILELVF